MAKKKKDLDFDNTEVEDEEIPEEFRKKGGDDDDDATEEVGAIVDKMLFGDIDEDDKDDSDDSDDDAELSHPAEIAARAQAKVDRSSGSDDNILRDLRKLVFSVPLMPQKEVKKRFEAIDDEINPMAYSIIEISGTYYEQIVQILIKVAAGNTYGKNIYEKEDNANEDKKHPLRGTYKAHEVDFMNSSYETLRLFAKQSSSVRFNRSTLDIKDTIDQSAFIRGVYEDILSDFVENTKHYMTLTWLALEAKEKQSWEEHSRLVGLLELIDNKLQTKRSCYAVARDAAQTFQNYQKTRSEVIAPYLRTVYSVARSTAKNTHQMLDNFQNGSIGLMRAVSCYSTNRPASFASVAKWWIKQMMLLAIKEDANFVKLPVSTWQAFTQLEKAKQKAGSNEDDIDKVAKIAKMSKKKAQSIYHTVKISQVYSLNKTYDSEEKLTLEDIMTNEDKLEYDPDNYNEVLRDYCTKAGLTEEELKVLALRHGMLDLIKESVNNKKDIMKESLVQNLANLGYNYKLTNTNFN